MHKLWLWDFVINFKSHVLEKVSFIPHCLLECSHLIDVAALHCSVYTEVFQGLNLDCSIQNSMHWDKIHLCRIYRNISQLQFKNHSLKRFWGVCFLFLDPCSKQSEVESCGPPAWLAWTIIWQLYVTDGRVVNQWSHAGRICGHDELCQDDVCQIQGRRKP